VIKPLPVNLVKNIKVPFQLDSIVLNNAAVGYTEINDKTGQEAILVVSRINGSIRNIHNRPFKNEDSLQFKVDGYIMDTAYLQLKVKESYTDTLSGFVMNVSVSPFNLTAMNPFLHPLAATRIKSGMLDTLYMRAIGREWLALGKMNFLYHDFNIEFLKNGVETKKTLLTGFESFVANSFVIKNKNTSSTSDIFFQRNRDKSFMNYWIKITMSDILTSVGIKTNKKAMKEYKRSIKKIRLPEITSQ
jgi:hypothetical protein